MKNPGQVIHDIKGRMRVRYTGIIMAARMIPVIRYISNGDGAHEVVCRIKSSNPLMIIAWRRYMLVLRCRRVIEHDNLSKVNRRDERNIAGIRGR